MPELKVLLKNANGHLTGFPPISHLSKLWSLGSAVKQGLPGWEGADEPSGPEAAPRRCSVSPFGVLCREQQMTAYGCGLGASPGPVGGGAFCAWRQGMVRRCLVGVRSGRQASSALVSRRD